MRRRLGLGVAAENDQALVQELLQRMQGSAVDYSLFFRRLGEETPERALASLRDDFVDREAFDRCRGLPPARRGRRRRPGVAAPRMHAVNPLYVLRNYLAQQAIEAAEQGDHGSPLAAPGAESPVRGTAGHGALHSAPTGLGAAPGNQLLLLTGCPDRTAADNAAME